MNNINFNEPAGVLIKTTLVDFPGTVAGAFFLKGCNLRCPYCYNISLVDQTRNDIELSSVNDLFNLLEKRQGLLEGLVISGGEPLINPLTDEIIKEAKSLNYKIKLDTNGLNPLALEKLINDKELSPDFIAMDVKTSLDRYLKELLSPNNFIENDKVINLLTKSINLLSELPQTHREFRTVLVPPLVKKEDIKNIASVLPVDASWKFASFQNKNCLNPLYNDILPYTDNEKKELIDYASTFIKNVELR